MNSDQISITISSISLMISLLFSLYLYLKSKAQAMYPILSDFCDKISLKNFGKIFKTRKIWGSFENLKEIWPQKYSHLLYELPDKHKMLLIFETKKDLSFSFNGLTISYSKIKNKIFISRTDPIQLKGFGD